MNNERREDEEEVSEEDIERALEQALLEHEQAARQAASQNNAQNTNEEDDEENWETEDEDEEEDAINAQPATTTSQSTLEEELSKLKGCQHYKRNCKIVAPCCNKVYPCRFCHNEAETKHEIDRFAVKEVVCSECDLRQPVSSECTKCHTVFAKYFCPKCKFFDNHPTKKIYHCDECGICRIGEAKDYFHCNVCNLCLGIGLKENHKCIQNTAHQDCPICMEFLFNSRQSVQIMKCGHSIHIKCFGQMINKGITACPLCGKSVVDLSHYHTQLQREIESSPMPQEYASMKVNILCKDCEVKSEVPFHIFGLKCPSCNSFNTARIK